MMLHFHLGSTAPRPNVEEGHPIPSSDHTPPRPFSVSAEPSSIPAYISSRSSKVIDLELKAHMRLPVSD